MSWLNLMTGSNNSSTVRNEHENLRGFARSLAHLEQQEGVNWRRPRLQVDVDHITETPIDSVEPFVEPRSLVPLRTEKPFIQCEWGHDTILPGALARPSAQPLHLFHTARKRKHVLNCYEFLLMRKLDEDEDLWGKLCERFGYCQQCQQEAEHASHHSSTVGSKDPFAINSISPDLWFLAITLQASKEKLIHFIRSEFPRRKHFADTDNIEQNKPVFAISAKPSFLNSYLSAFNFVELNLDSVFKPGEGGELPRELFKCVNIKTLSVRNNYLETIPSDIGRLAKLERLILTNNRLKNKSIPFTIAFCEHLTELYLDDNLLDALPGILLRLGSLEVVHRHGNHNYFKATFMWYHTNVNDRILECPASPSPGSSPSTEPPSLQYLCGLSVLSSRHNFLSPSSSVPVRLKETLCRLAEDFELCSACSRPLQPVTAHCFKVFTFKNPYLGNFCVPFQHLACSFQCARAVEVPARREQLTQAREQDRRYEEYVRESTRRLRPSQRALSLNSLLGSSSHRSDPTEQGNTPIGERESLREREPLVGENRGPDPNTHRSISPLIQSQTQTINCGIL